MGLAGGALAWLGRGCQEVADPPEPPDPPATDPAIDIPRREKKGSGPDEQVAPADLPGHQRMSTAGRGSSHRAYGANHARRDEDQERGSS